MDEFARSTESDDLWIPRQRLGPYRLGGSVGDVGSLSLLRVVEMDDDHCYRWMSKSGAMLMYVYEDDRGRELSVVDGLIVAVDECRQVTWQGRQLIGLPIDEVTRALGSQPELDGPYDGRFEDLWLAFYHDLGAVFLCQGEGGPTRMAHFTAIIASVFLEPSETLLVGSWSRDGDCVVADTVARRIEELASVWLEKLGRDHSGWFVLYRDPEDGRLWELSYPQGQMQGGGPPQLRAIHAEEARRRFPAVDFDVRS